MTKMQALQHFFERFGWDVYDGASVPDDARLPYLTYEGVTNFFGYEDALSASAYDRSTSWASVTSKVEQIANYITRGGVMEPYDNGALWIKRGTPWAQRLSDEEDDTIRRIVMNIEIEFID